MEKNELEFENCINNLESVISKSHAAHVVKSWRQLQNDFCNTLDLPQVAFGEDTNDTKTIVLSWSNKKFYCEIEIHDDGLMSSFIRDRQNDVYAGDNAANNKLNDSVIAMLKHLNDEFIREKLNTSHCQYIDNQYPSY